MENARLREAAPTSVNVTVGKRSREYLTDREVERLVEAAKQNRSGHRDATSTGSVCTSLRQWQGTRIIRRSGFLAIQQWWDQP